MFDLKAVLFDLGGTLIKTAPVPLIYKRILAAHGIHLPIKENDPSFREVDEELSFADYTLPYDEFWRISDIKTLRRLGIRENLEELAAAVTDEWHDNSGIEIYPDVKETLEMLKERGLKMGVVTNGFRFDIEDNLARIGLSGMFDATVGVDDVGTPKPNKEIFLYAVRKLGVEPHEALFVGDNPEVDYEGAENAGLKTVLIDRSNGVRGEFRKIRDLREIIEYL
ncbi:MAG: HAD family hydrolase [Candidatus Bathyarchaeota archaeon]|nr:HAD family hydrolase [Candidatus Bathyarchaeota archaeon]